MKFIEKKIINRPGSRSLESSAILINLSMHMILNVVYVFGVRMIYK